MAFNHDNIASQGFDYFWADETEPDLPPDGAYLSIGPGTECPGQPHIGNRLFCADMAALFPVAL